MKTEALKALMIVVMGSLLITACVSHRAERAVVVTPSGQIITQEPPPPRSEVASVSPGADYVWLPGSWTYQNTRWVWIPGHWEHTPRSNTAWVPGHWDKVGRNWVWTPGHWS